MRAFEGSRFVTARRVTFSWAVLLLCASASRADPAVKIDAATLRRAVERGLAVAEKAARSYPEHRACFSCHHQTLPLLAMRTAWERGVRIDHALLEEQAAFTHGSFEGRIERMKKGEGVGGASMTVGYGLWALDIVSHRRDETTAAMVEFLLRDQEEDGSWRRFTSRPPLEDSSITSTVLAAHYMPRFASAKQRERVEAAIERSEEWLRSAPVESQEDLNSRLGGLALLRAEKTEVRRARDAVLAAQREDGGWAQLREMESDAYATGQTLFTLQRAGLSTEHPAYRRGIRFLLETQLEDGSWHVKSRSKPIQRFFDNGDPHGKDQFISIPATSWATTALALALPRPEVREF